MTPITRPLWLQQPHHRRRHNERARWCGKAGQYGFTLVELMVTVAIVAILAAIAYPSYTSYVQRGRRAEVKAALLENAGALERYFSTNFRYTATAGNAGCPALAVQCLPRAVLSASCNSDSRVYYKISGACDAAGNKFTLTATPTGVQTNDSCGSLALDNLGKQTPTTTNCW